MWSQYIKLFEGENYLRKYGTLLRETHRFYKKKTKCGFKSENVWNPKKYSEKQS